MVKRLPSYHMLRIMGALLNNRNEEMFGNELSRATGLPSGTLYALLKQMVEQDILFVPDQSTRRANEEKRLERKLTDSYRLTPKAAAYAEKYGADIIATQPLLVPFEDFEPDD